MRWPLNRAQINALGIADWQLRQFVHEGRWQRVIRGFYVEGRDKPTRAEVGLAVVVASGGVASHSFAAYLYELDSVSLRPPFASIPIETNSRRKALLRHTYRPDQLVEMKGMLVTNGTQTLLDVCGFEDARVLEQLLESALRKKITSIAEIEMALNSQRVRGRYVLRKVLDLRPAGAPATESLLETLMVQLARDHGLPEPSRQVEVLDASGRFVGRVDLAYPNQGVFFELDGSQHIGQPSYDAVRQTAVVAATGWKPGRFTWNDVTKTPSTTARRVRQLLVSDHKFLAS